MSQLAGTPYSDSAASHSGASGCVIPRPGTVWRRATLAILAATCSCSCSAARMPSDASRDAVVGADDQAPAFGTLRLRTVQACPCQQVVTVGADQWSSVEAPLALCLNRPVRDGRLSGCAPELELALEIAGRQVVVFGACYQPARSDGGSPNALLSLPDESGVEVVYGPCFELAAVLVSYFDALHCGPPCRVSGP